MTDLAHIEHELRAVREHLFSLERMLAALIYDISEAQRDRKAQPVGVALIDEYAPANTDDPA